MDHFSRRGGSRTARTNMGLPLPNNHSPFILFDFSCRLLFILRGGEQYEENPAMANDVYQTDFCGTINRANE